MNTGGGHAVATDGVVSSYLALLVTAATHRRRGVARALADEGFARSGVGRMDLLADAEAHAFYRSMPHRTLPGFRVFDGYRGGHVETRTPYCRIKDKTEPPRPTLHKINRRTL